MWYEHLDKNKFISNLYGGVSELTDVRIAEVKILDEGNRVSISFDMPCFPENPPKKWVQAGYNTVNVKIDLFEIHELVVKSNKTFNKGSVEINKKDSINVAIKGKFDAEISATLGLIQSVEGYIKNA